MVFSVADVVHAEEETTEDDEIIIKDLTREELGEYIDINSMVIMYDVDADLLLDKIYNDLHSDSVIFSPFTNIELGISDAGGAETYNMARTAPYVVFDHVFGYRKCLFKWENALCRLLCSSSGIKIKP